jgi:hypothetical protein
MAARKRFFTSIFGLLAVSSYLAPLALAQQAPDFSQAMAMLDLLRSCAADKVRQTQLDQVLALPGTELIVSQQNISRQVTMQQYREVLQAACRGVIAEVKPAEPGARAAKGVAGLREDVAPSIIWGRDHVPLLESRLAELRRNQSIGDAIPLAQKYLPAQSVPVEIDPKLYVVMGGRAGAAAIEDQLYYDVLIMTWRASRGEVTPMSPEQVIEFFAHETHHLAYGQILDRRQKSLTMTPAEDQAWGFLKALMMEGSATLLINGHEKLADLQKQPDVAAYLSKVPELLPAMQTILRRALHGLPLSDENYAEAELPFLNMGYHATGAVLLAAIEKRRGLAGVMEVMADPRRLLAAYNESAADSAVTFEFDASLAEWVRRMGEAKTK